MVIALIDNGSLEPAAHRNLRSVAAALSERTGVLVHAVSWKHSDRIPVGSLAPEAWTLAPFIRHHLAHDENEFLFVPFFISAQGAIGSALRNDLETLRREVGEFSFTLTDGLAVRGALSRIVVDQVQEVVTAKGLHRPHVIVVDHGGPSRSSAELRNAIAAEVRAKLGDRIGLLVAASLEGAEYEHARPLLADAVAQISPVSQDATIVVARLFLAPGRHAGPHGDITRICEQSRLNCEVTALVGDHPLVIETLSAALRDALAARTQVPTPLEAGAYVS